MMSMIRTNVVRIVCGIWNGLGQDFPQSDRECACARSVVFFTYVKAKFATKICLPQCQCTLPASPGPRRSEDLPFCRRSRNYFLPIIHTCIHAVFTRVFTQAHGTCIEYMYSHGCGLSSPTRMKMCLVMLCEVWGRGEHVLRLRKLVDVHSESLPVFV